MKQFFAAFVILMAALALKADAQSDSVAQFNVAVKKHGLKNYNLTLNAKIESGWHLYGLNSSESIDAIAIHLDDEQAIIISLNATTQPVVIDDAVFDNKKLSVFKDQVTFKAVIKINGIVPTQLKGMISGFVGKAKEFQPVEQSFVVPLEGGLEPENAPIKIASIKIDQPLTSCGTMANQKKNNLWDVFLFGCLGGLIALLTPCVFPIIPLTVSFFTGRSSTKQQGIRNGILYGLFILLIYTAASIPFHLLGKVQPEIFNNIATSPILNIIFFLIFICFAISLFGLVEINLPSTFANKADAKGSLGSISGIFFMALTLVIISFSCTGPILGTLLVGSLSNGAWPLTAGLAGFGFALALPFALFAVFPDWLKALPRSGGWLDTVKKVLAFVELALAFKFLSNADLVMHWGILKREVFFAVWIIISIALALYLFGFYRLPKETKSNRLSWGRMFFATLILLFAIYLVPGLTNTVYANVKLLSGFPPPLSYSIYEKDTAKGKGLEPDVINDYDTALQMAKAQHKLLLVDFTGWACVNCRKMEEQVWIKPEVSAYIRKHFILVSLYVDDKQKLPATQRVFDYKTKDGTTKDILTVGDKWATFQAENAGQVTQPLYMILNEKQELINNPVGYTPNPTDYVAWLSCGVNGKYNK